jgi:hypothetical protein
MRRSAADDLHCHGRQGVSSLSHEKFKSLMTGAQWELLSYEISDVQARQLTDDVAVVAYKVTENLCLEQDADTGGF